MANRNLLIVDDDESIRSQMKWAFQQEYNVLEAKDRPGALEIVRTIMAEVVILDLGLPPRPNDATEGLKALEEILGIDPAIKVLVATGNTEKGNALKAIELGAFDFFTKPVIIDEMRVTVRRAFHVHRLERENIELRIKLDNEGLGEMLGASRPMQEVFSVIRKVASTDVPVLILGESGTGKELAASAIHKLSDRSDGPFIIINCGAIPENLLESELFGHEKGAFTGADKMRKGKIEYAEGGTLFLDEIGELSPALQVKLLRFLQEHTIDRVGGREPIQVDVRVLAATNRDIKAMVGSGAFREDLYYRLGVVAMEMPPLRKRDNDTGTLALSFLKKYSKAFKRDISGFCAEAIEAMGNYSWPGNIRELENKIKRAVAMAQGNEITPEDLSLTTPEPKVTGTVKGFIEAREEFEKRMVHEALLRNKGVVSRTAQELGISRQYLSELLKKYGIKQ